MSDVVIEAREYGDPDVVRMIAEVQAEYVVRYGGPDEAVMDAAEFVPPAGLFLVGSVDGDAVATGAWRTTAPGEAEIKRMYVAARMRRRGLARAMLAEVERTAVAAGIRRLVLNTGLMQPEAVALYRSAGYVDADPYGIYADAHSAVFLGREL